MPETVTIRPPTYYDAEQMSELVEINRTAALPGNFANYHRRRSEFWQTYGIGVIRQAIEMSIEMPDRYFTVVAAADSRIAGYARGHVVDFERSRRWPWQYIDPPADWQVFDYDPFEERELPRDKCYNSCDGLMIHPDFQGRGLGRHLSTTRLALMMHPPTRYYPVRSFVPITNFDSQAFHQRLGFEPIATREPTETMPAPMLVMELQRDQNRQGWDTYHRAQSWQYPETHRFALRNPEQQTAI